ncbi:alpha/beta fold hydrolase [Limnohabitans sp. 63ED37-2]|uniref:alpha/beta fold hydrolase n=1 Tax=Limnohabitans sp. 63ED37-2 TaxID=1678128 RepID=UPI0007062952|nr:alpha/beta hydrolase [Limnohabitans sp. 63ED37-2]ALK87531.1 Haloalkane dehalogenase [Limnohabitans sp. 63ED37-2]
MHPDIQTWQQTLPHGITLSCRACGEPGRPVLLFLHGFPEGAWVWDPLLRHFSRPENGRYRCVAPNLRGYERSSAPEDVKAYRAKHLAQDIVALIDSECGPLPGGRPLAALIAHDWGGAVAWSLANQNPHRMRQLVVLNSPHPGPFLRALQHDPAQQAASAYMNFLVQPDAAAQLAAKDFERMFGFLTGQDTSLQSLTAPTADTQAHWLTPAVKAQYREVWQHGLQGGLNYYRASPLRPATATDPGASAVQIPPEALRIEVPTLLLWALGDVALLPCLTEGLDAHIPDLKLVPIAQATHWVVHEQPARVIQEIANFLPPSDIKPAQ